MDDRVVNVAAVVAVGVRETGEQEVLGFDVGPAKTYEFLLDFLRSLVVRGLINELSARCRPAPASSCAACTSYATASCGCAINNRRALVPFKILAMTAGLTAGGAERKICT